MSTMPACTRGHLAGALVTLDDVAARDNDEVLTAAALDRTAFDQETCASSMRNGAALRICHLIS